MQPDIGRRVDDGLMMGQMGAHAYGTEREITSRGLRKIQGEFCAPIDSPVGGHIQRQMVATEDGFPDLAPRGCNVQHRWSVVQWPGDHCGQLLDKLIPELAA